MSGEQKDVITLSDTKFAVSRDHGADGLFEEDVCEGSIIFYGFSVRFRVPIDCLPDIATKRIWVYSIKSGDRLPDSEALSFTSSKDEDCPTEGVADIPSDIATLDPSEQTDKVTVTDQETGKTENGLLTVELDGSICALTRLDKLDIDLSGGLNIDAVFSFGLSALVKGNIDVKLPTQTATMVVRGLNADVSVVGEEATIEGIVTSQTSLKAELGVEGFVGISPTVTGYLLNDKVSVKADIPAGMFLNAATQIPQFPACTKDYEDEKPSCAVPHDGEIKVSVGVDGAELSYAIGVSDELGIDPIADKFKILESFSNEVLKLCLCCDLTSVIPCREDYCLKTPDPTPRPTSRPTPSPTPQPPPAIPCSATVRPGGGKLREEFSVEMGTTRGSFFMSYDMVNIPDRIQVCYEGREIYDSVFKISGCYSDIEISYGPGASTRVDFVITSDDTDTEWTVATGCPEATRYWIQQGDSL